MAIQIGHWERRDGIDREKLAQAALDFCRASRAVEGMRSVRFYWTGPDGIVLQSDAESFEVFDRPLGAESARAAFALADLARKTGSERWTDPRSGETAYRAAGR